MARVARDEHFSVPEHGVLEAQGCFAELRELRAQRQLVVEEGRLLVAREGFYDDEAEAPLLHFPIRNPGGAEPLHTPDLEVGEVVGVVDYPLRVGLGVTDAQLGLVY